MTPLQSGRAWLVSLALALAGCIEDFEPASLVTDARPIAAQVSVEGDPERAWPLPGESFNVAFHVVAPADRADAGWALAACPALETGTGESFCVGEPFAFAFQEAPVADAPSIRATVPDDASIEAILVIGVLCFDSSPFFDMATMDAGCADEASELIVQVTVRVAQDAATANQNPMLLDDFVLLEGAPWTARPEDVSLTACAGGAGPEISAAREATIAFALPDEARETYVVGEGETARERVTITHAATMESFARLLSSIDDVDPEAEVEWTPEPAAPARDAGDRVKFFFVARDNRGGVAYTERALCLVP